MNFHLEPTLSLIQEHFKTRNDVFAVFWQKGNKSGFMPAYYYDPYRYQLHKRSGGNFKNYKDKSFLPLNKEEWIKHLKGEKLIG
ncbi:MAG: hypothetical protein KTR26_20485, partial [Flammeovirgaceae bacterium]|nr:hypothetical protein [Flammeovirgaceae bacterium]